MQRSQAMANKLSLRSKKAFEVAGLRTLSGALIATFRLILAFQLT